MNSFALFQKFRRTAARPVRLEIGIGPWLGFVAILLFIATRLCGQQPTGGTVVAGNATIATAPGSTTITAGNNSILRWNSFDVGAGQTVQFVQPGADSRVMNWIGNLTPSQINGTLLANGQVYLLNPAGVYFGQTAVVDVGHLYAIGGSLSRDDFLAGLNRFTSLTGDIRNDGTLRGSAVALIGRTVLNTGTIISTDGFIALGAGEQVLLGRNGSGIYVDAGRSATPGTPTIANIAGVANTGSIDAGRGSAILAAGDIYSVAITQDGKLSARDVRLQGQGRGDVLVSGMINAAATKAGDMGGSITITGDRVGLLDGAVIDASGPAGGGTILVGGDTHGANAAVRNASATSVTKGAMITADATSAGNGGKVVVWSDGDTLFSGNIFARGAGKVGAGGFTEVSGKKFLNYRGFADLSAGSGLTGTLLLDPTDITITGAGNDSDPTTGSFAGGTFGGGSNATSTIFIGTGSGDSNSTLLKQLSAANVIITTASAGGGTGNINVAGAINYTSAHSLSLLAGNNLNISSLINNHGSGNLTVAATAGTVTVTAPITLAGGDFASSGTNFTSSGSGAITTNGGAINLSHTGAVSLGAQLSSASTGAVGLPGNANTVGDPGLDGIGGAITIGAGTLTVTGSGSIASDGTGGHGGKGGNGNSGNNGANGGQGGAGTAGAIIVNATTVDFQTGSAISADGAGGKGGNGGNGASGNNDGGDGGDNGNGTAGAITLNAGGSFAGTISSVGSVSGSLSVGGNGTGSGNDGSAGAAGTATSGTITLNNSTTVTAAGNSVAGRSLVLQGSGDVGTSGARFSTSAPKLVFTKSGGTTFVSSGAVDLGGTSTGTAALNLSATGNITQTTNLVAPGTLTLLAPGQNIQLDRTGNNFNVVGASGQDVTLWDTNGLVLAATTATNDFEVRVGAGGSLTQNGIINVSGATTLQAAAVNTDINLSTSANNFASTPGFNGTLLNIRDFLYRNDNGSAGLPAIGSMSGLRDLLINLPNSTINLTGTVASTGTQTYQSAVSLAADTTLSSSGSGTAGNITFASTLGGAHDLIVNTAGTTGFNGAVSGLTSLTTDSAGDTTLGASITTTGAQTYQDAVTLGGNVTLTGTALTLGSTLAGAANDLTLAFSSGNPVDGAKIGTVKNLTANNGTTTLTGTVTTTGTQTYNSGATLGTDTTLVSSGVGVAGNVTFNSALGGAHDLTVNTAGTTAFNGTVSGLTGLTTDSAGSTALGASITTTGSQAYHDAVTIETGTAVLSTTNSAISFSGTVNSHTGSGNSLTLSTGTAAPTFSAAVGGTDALGTLTLTNTAAGGVTLPAVTAQNLTVSTGGTLGQSGVLSIAGTTSLTATGQTILLNNGGNNFNVVGASGQNVTLVDTNGLVLGASTVTGNLDVTIGSSGTLTQNGIVSVTGSTTLRAGAANTDINLSTSANNFVSAPVFGGTQANVRDFLFRNDYAAASLPAIASLTNLRNLLINLPNSTINLGGTVSSTGTQTYQSATSLAADATLVSSGTGNAGNISFNSTLGGAHNLIVNTAGTTAFNGTVSGVTSITTDLAGATTLGASVTTTGAQNFNDPVTLGGDTTLTGTALTLGSTLTGVNHDLTLAFSSGNPVNGAAIGGVKNLTANTGATTLSGAITTSGTQTYNTATTLGADATLTSTGSGDITFNSTLGGAHNLIVNTAGTTAFNGTVNGVTSVTTNAAGSTTLGADITTTGAQIYNDAVTLGTNVILTGTTLSLGSTLAGAGNDLTLAFSVGNALTGAGISGVRNLVTSVGPTTLSGTITTSGTQTYNTAVTLSGDTTLTGTTLSLGSTLAGAGHDLTLAFSTGNAVASTSISGVKNLTTSGGATNLSGSITTTGTQNYTTAVTLTGSNTILTGTALTLGSTITGSGSNDLTLAFASGNVVNGALITGVRNLTTTTGTTTLTGAVTTTGTQTYNTATTLTGDTTLTGTALTWGSTLAGAGKDLTLAFSLGNVVNGAVIGGVKNLTTNTGATSLTGAITTTGTQTYNTSATLTGNTILTGTALTLGSTLSGGSNDLTLAFSTGNTVNGAVITGMKNLTTNTGATSLTGAITTTGTQAYNTAVTLTGNTTLTGTALTWGSTLTGAANDLTLAFSTGNTVNGAVIGGVKNLVTNSGPTSLTGAITTSGTQTYNTAATLTGVTTLTGTTLALGSTLSGANNDLTLAFSGGNTVAAPTISGVKNLTTTSGATTLSGSISTNGTQNYTTPTTLASDVALTSLGAGAAGNITLGSTVGGAKNLTVNTGGTTAFNGVVSGLTSLTTDTPGSTAISASISTTGAQIYHDVVTLGTDVTLTGTALTLGSTLTGNSHDLTLAFSSGNVVNGAAIGEVKNLTTNTGATTLTGPITTSGTQTYNTAATLGGTTTLTGTALSLGSTLAGAGNDLTLAFSTGNTLTGAGITGVKNLTTAVGATTLSGAITTTGTQNYQTAVTLAGDTTLTGTTLALGSTLTGASHNLGLVFSSGNIVNGAVIGGVQNLATSVGPTTLTGLIATSGTQTYNTAVTLGGDTSLTGTALSLGSTLAGGNHDLTLGFTVGDTLTGAGITGVKNLTTNVGPTTLSGPITTTGTQTYNTAVTLAGNTTLTGTALSLGSTLTGSGNDLTLAFSTGNNLTNAAILGVKDLTVNVGPTTMSGAITTSGTQTYNTAVTLAGNATLTGTTLNIGNLTGGNHDLALAFSLGNVVNPTVISGLKNLTTSVGPTTLSGAITTTGTQTYNTATTLSGATTLTGTALSLGSTLAGAGNDLTLAFSTGNVLTSSGITGVRNLATSIGLTTLSGPVTTSGTQTYNTAVTLAGDTTLTGTALTLGSTVDGAGHDLTLAFASGSTVNGALFSGVKDLTTDVGPTTLLGSITTSGAQSYNTATTLAGNTMLTGATLNLGSTLAGGGNDLALVFSAGNTVNGTGVTGVRNLSTSGGPTTLSGPITTTGTQTYGTATTLTGNTTLSTTNSGVSFVSTLNSASGGGYDLNVTTGTALASFGGAVGGSAGGSLGTLTINNSSGTGVALPAITAQSLNVVTAGPVTNTGNLSIGGAAAINAGAGNAITLGTTTTANFGSLALTGGNVTIREGSDMQITSATANNLDLTTTAGAVRIDAANTSLLLRVNSAAATSLGVVSAGSLDISAGGTVTDDNGPVTVAGATTIVSRTNGDIILDNPGNDFFTGTFTGNTITLTDANALILQTVLAQGAFTANANGLLTVATALNGAGNVSLISNSSNVLISSAVSSSGGNVLVQAGQDVIQSAPITNTGGADGITINAGGNAQLVGLSTAGGPVSVTAGANGSAQFGTALTINGPFTVTAGTGGVTFAQALNGGGATSDLTVNTTGSTLFSAAIGAGTTLHSLTTDAGGTTTLAGGSVRATSLVFGDKVTVTRDTTITGGSANFKSTVGGSSDGGQSLLVDISGDAIFGGAVGPAGTRFSTLTTTAGGRTLFNGGGVSTTGAQTYHNAVVIGADAVFSSDGAGAAGNISFNNTVDGAFALTINTAGTTGFGGNVGTTTALTSVITDAPGAVHFNVAGSTAAKPTVKTTGAQTYNDAITLDADTALSSGTGNISIPQAVTGKDKAFAVAAPQGTITVLQNLGSDSARLASVAINGRNVVLAQDIWATGDIALGIGSGSSATDNDFLRFNVDGAAARNTRIDSLTGEIILGGGAAGSPVKTAAPLRSSIFKGNDGDLYLFAHKITVQPFERMAVRNGSLIAIADGTGATDGITMSNTAVSNYLVLASSNPGAPGITFRSRGPADIYQAQGVVPDLGTDLIAGAVFFFDARFGVLPTRTQFAPTPTPSSDPTFFDYATRTGNILANGGVLSLAVLPDAAGVTHNVFIADLLVTNPFRPLRPNVAYLDLSTASGFGGFRDGFIGAPTFGVTSDAAMRTLVATGAQIRNTPEQVFTPDVPRKDRETAPPEADLASAVREQLQALGIYARALRGEERVSRERRAGLFVTVPEREHPQVSDYEVADARVEDRAVREVIRLATEAGLLGQGQEKLNDVGQAFAASFDAFSATSTSGTAHEYRVWLEARHDADADRVLKFVASLRSALTRIELLGLTTHELEGSKAQIYGSILRARLNTDPEFLRALVQDLPSNTPVALLRAFDAPGKYAAKSP